MKAVLDPNVLIASLLSPSGAPGRLVVAWTQGWFELIVSPPLLQELAKSLTYPKLMSRITAGQANEFVDLLKSSARLAADPATPCEIRCTDGGDQYLVDLAFDTRSRIVSGDRHLLALANKIPVAKPADFLELIAV